MMNDTQTEIVEALRASDESMTVPALANEIHRGATTVRKALKELVASGDVTKIDEKGQAARYSVEAAPSSNPTKRRKKEDQEIPEDLDGRARPNVATDTRRNLASTRDEQVAAAIARAGDGISKAEIAEEIGVKESLVYVSLWRLAKQEKIEKKRVGTRTPIWVKGDA